MASMSQNRRAPSNDDETRSLRRNEGVKEELALSSGEEQSGNGALPTDLTVGRKTTSVSAILWPTKTRSHAISRLKLSPKEPRLLVCEIAKVNSLRH